MEPHLDDHTLQSNLLEAAHGRGTNKPKPVPFTWMAYASNLVAISLLVLYHLVVRLGGTALVTVLAYSFRNSDNYPALVKFAIATAVPFGIIVVVLLVLYLMVGTKAFKRSMSSACSVGVMITLTLALCLAYTTLLLTQSSYVEHSRSDSRSVNVSVSLPWESLKEIKNVTEKGMEGADGRRALAMLLCGIISILPALALSCCILCGEFNRQRRNRPDIYGNVMGEEGVSLADDESTAAPSAPVTYEEEIFQSAQQRASSGYLPTAEHFLNKVVMWECGLALYQLYSNILGALFEGILNVINVEGNIEYGFLVIPGARLIVMLVLVPFAMVPLICRRRGVWLNLVNIGGSMLVQLIYGLSLAGSLSAAREHWILVVSDILGMLFSTGTSVALMVVCVVHIVTSYVTHDPYRF